MTNKIIMGQFTETDSVLHRLDPRTKLLSLLVIMLSFLLLKSFASYLAATVLVGMLLRMSGIRLGWFARGLKPLLLILIFTFLYHVLLTGDTVIWSWSFIKLTEEGLTKGTITVWRIILLVLIASVLTATTKPLVLAQGLEKLLKPLSRAGLPTETYSLMIGIAIRFIPTIIQEMDRIILAQQARGYDIRSIPGFKRVFAYIPILVPLFATTIQRAEQLSYAIDARAFGTGKGRTSYRQLQFKRSDLVAALFTVIFVLIMLLIRIYG